MVEGAGLEMKHVKETLGAKLAEKEQETLRLTQAKTPPPSNVAVEEHLLKSISSSFATMCRASLNA